MDINRAAQFNDWEMYSATPLILAVYGQKVSMVKSILGSRDVDVNAKAELGYTALFMAVIMNGNTDDPSTAFKIVEALLEIDGIDVNVAGHNGATPLHAAAAQGDIAATKRLLSEEGIEHFPKDYYGDTPMDYAESEGYDEIVELFEELV